MKKLWIGVFLVLIVAVVGIWAVKNKEEREKVVRTLKGEVTFTANSDTPGYENFQKMVNGCPTRDCIPALNKPKFETVAQADSWLKYEDLVIGLDYEGEHRAYPIKILNWHEVINDGKVLITYCPLTGSAIAYENQGLTFGISGKVFNSNSVMYDQETESLWQQITGEATVGEHLGKKLKPVEVDMMSWGEWKSTHTATQVLSRETGYERDYNEHPYGTYDSDKAIYYPVRWNENAGIESKTVVYGIIVGELPKAYTLEAITRETAEDSILNDHIGDKRLRISYNNGKVFVEDLQTKGTIMAQRMYWLGWSAFYPKTELYK